MGLMAFGTTPLGLSEEVVTETIGTQNGSRYLDPVTRDYATRDGEILRAGSARQRIINLLVTDVKTSLSIKGIKFPDLHNESTVRAVQSDVRRTLQIMIDDGSIILQSVDVRERADGVVGRLGISVSYIDRGNGQEDTVTA